MAWNASGKAVCRAAVSACTKTRSSLSLSSRESQAVGRAIVSTHAVSRVVLPKPTGVESRVTLPLSPAFRRSMRRARGMTSLLGRGR